MEKIRVAGEFNPRMTAGLVPGSLNSHLGRPQSHLGSPPSQPGSLVPFLHSRGFPGFPRCKLEHSFGPDLPLFVPGFMARIRKWHQAGQGERGRD